MVEKFEPNIDEFSQIVREYALLGVRDYRENSEDIRRPIRQRLLGHVEEDKDKLQAKFARLGKGQVADFSFIPTPKVSHGDFKFAFFKPSVAVSSDGVYTCKLYVLFWIDHDSGKLVAVRLEPADKPKYAHSYSHLQVTKSIKLKMDGDTEEAFRSDQDGWMPDSYPGFALGYRHPIHFFAGLAIAVHGYASDKSVDDFVRKVYRRCYPNAQQAVRYRKVMDEIDRKFG